MKIVNGGFTVMEQVSKWEKQLAAWYENAPHLPQGGQKWLGANVWWIVAIGVVLSAIGVLTLIGGLFTSIGLMTSSVAASYYVTTTALGWVVVTAVVALVFTAIECVLLATAVTPLKEKQKKGWNILFIVWLLSVAYAVVAAVLTLNVFSAFASLLFSAVFAIIGAYFLFEIRGQFGHVEKSVGVKSAAAPKVKVPKEPTA